MPIALAVHGGAWNIPDDEVDAHTDGVSRALREGWNALRSGAEAIDVVELVIRILEDDTTFNAGRGSHLNEEAKLELDASIMEGHGLAAGGVAAITGVLHPITVARRVMEETPHVLLVGAGARRFAREAGCELAGPKDLLVGRELERYLRVRRGDRRAVDYEFRAAPAKPHGTVGAAALDRKGRLAAGTSTGGTQHKMPGRVGDTPIVGAGTYADDRAGAASSTGWGEAILRVALAKTAVDHLRAGAPPSSAGRSAIAALRRVDGTGGIILVDRTGRAAAAFNAPRMARGIATETGGLRVRVHRSGRRR